MTAENNPTPRWKSPPKTLSAALKRIEVLEQNAYWIQSEIAGCREWGERGWAEVSRLGRLLTYRAKVGDANASRPHANTEIGKLSGNTYCSDCQEILAEGTRLAKAYFGKQDAHD